MNKLIEGNNKYCVPAVLSILTGKSVDDCASLLSSLTGRAEIKEVYWSETLKALKSLRINVEEIESLKDTSLFTSFHYLARMPGVYIVRLKGSRNSGHMIAIESKDSQVFLCDNHTKEPINGAASARLSQRVETVHKCEMLPEPKILHESIDVILQDNGYLYINRTTTFDTAPTQTMRLGSIRFRDKNELANIMATIIVSPIYQELMK